MRAMSAPDTAERKLFSLRSAAMLVPSLPFAFLADALVLARRGGIPNDYNRRR